MVIAHCIDCRREGITTWRSAPHPGPRCYSHNLIKVKESKAAAADRQRDMRYGVTGEEYRRVLAVQEGRCAICQVATGATKRLAVDHDHRQAEIDGHDPSQGCGRCFRGLLCSNCNSTLAHAHDNPEFFYRAIAYLREWPSMRANV